jgi:hypothetical protein
VRERERERKNERVFPFEFCSLLRRRANDMKEKETQTRTDDGVAALLLALLPFRERVLFSLLVSSSIFFVPARARGTHAHTHKGAHENGAKAGIENSSFPRKIAGYLGCENSKFKKKRCRVHFLLRSVHFLFWFKNEEKIHVNAGL